MIKSIRKNGRFMFTVMGLALTFAACRSEATEESMAPGTADTSESVKTETTAPVEIETTVPTETQTKKPKEIIKPRIVEFDKYSGALPVELPEGCECVEGRAYQGTKKQYEELLSRLTAHGYKLHRCKYSDYLFKDDSMICINFRSGSTKEFTHEKETFYIGVTRKTPFVYPDGMTYEEVAALSRYGKDSQSPLQIHPIDITPEGVYESTGGQIFAVPVYSYDEYTLNGETDLMFQDDEGKKENENYRIDAYFVDAGKMVLLGMSTFAVADIDEDGSGDILAINYGPTSGLYTIVLHCITNHGVYKSDVIYDTSLRTVPECTGAKLTVNDGKIKIGDCWDIVLEDSPDNKRIQLYCNGNPARLY